ncbi:MAG: thioredoxin family protein [Cytophagales bacterium]|nr:thioredoxin family protein [Cytophagales bacterium]
MAKTLSSMMPLGTQAPDFNLLDVISNEKKSIEEVKGGEGLVVMFICAHCPYVIHIQEEIAFIAERYIHRGIEFVAICSNDVESHPEDAPDKLREQGEEQEFDFPYLYDETQEVAKAYQAVCTPDFYLFNKELKCVYRGRFDAATPDNDEPVNGDELKDAMESLLEGEPVFEDQKPSMGCSIKWK